MVRQLPSGPIWKARVLFITSEKEDAREIVLRIPCPALGKMSSPLLKGMTVQMMFIKAMMEKPT